MRFRRVSAAVGVAAVAGGVFYAYRTNNNAGLAPQQTRYASSAQSASPTGPPSDDVSDAVRKALVIEPTALYTAVLPSDQPISKDTDDYGRKIVEMMTPDQVTQKLRTNEESYLVGRGRGVVRYDVVQLPSNNPIEDDHAEKIIDVPQTVAATENGANSTDWMFWGVFDGHSYVGSATIGFGACC